MTEDTYSSSTVVLSNDDKDFKKPYPPGLHKRHATENRTHQKNGQNTECSKLQFDTNKTHCTSHAKQHNEAKRVRQMSFRFDFPADLVNCAKTDSILDQIRKYDIFVNFDDDNDKIPSTSSLNCSKAPVHIRFQKREENSDDKKCTEEFEEEEDEDVYSDGEIDEELQAVVDKLSRKKLDEKNETDSPEPTNTGGPLSVNDDSFISLSDLQRPPNGILEAKTNKEKHFRIPVQEPEPEPKANTARYIIPMVYNYQLFFRNNNEPLQLEEGLEIVGFNGIDGIQQISSIDRRYLILANEISKSERDFTEGDPITVFDNRFVLVKKLVPAGLKPLKLFYRTVPRDPLIEPPIMEEVIEMTEHIVGKHPRASQYPEEWTYAMVEYAEDRYWTERTIKAPAGLSIPPRPIDYYDIRMRTPPPEDFHFVPPEGTPPIPIPEEAWELFEERKRLHFQQLADDQEINGNRGLGVE